MANKTPREGSRAWERSLAGNPTYARNAIRSLADRAAGGDREAVDHLLHWLDRHPDLRPLVRGLDDLVARAERAWVERLSGTDELARKAIADDLAALRAGLLGPDPSAVEKVLAATVVVAHAAYSRAALAAAAPGAGPAVRAAREKVLSVAQKRLQDAVRGWELIAGKKAAGARPRGTVMLFDPGQATA